MFLYVTGDFDLCLCKLSLETWQALSQILKGQQSHMPCVRWLCGLDYSFEQTIEVVDWVAYDSCGRWHHATCVEVSLPNGPFARECFQYPSCIEWLYCINFELNNKDLWLSTLTNLTSLPRYMYIYNLAIQIEATRYDPISIYIYIYISMAEWQDHTYISNQK